ncbi:poly(ethylene terephthalate) hydrolase family protein [Actinomadura sp. 3N407]|uniref:poly(ethylene terephthalate) hydrolase family protein n=1 Tax=Actinomadura sp. 3N407 TaxID=3457423 RepID=UPI003FCC7006
MKRRGTALLAAVALTASFLQGPAAADTTPHGIPTVGHAWADRGPYDVHVDIEAVTTFYRPVHMGTHGEKHPVIIWGNGTFVVPGVYSALLRHWASHGFIVAASNSTQANSGLSMRHGIDTLTKRNADPGSVFHQKVDLGRIASAGHSQGGAGAINAAVDPRVDTAVGIEPGPLTDPDLIDEPALYMAGEKDSIVFPFMVKALYNDSDHIPAVYAELRGANHLTAAWGGGGFRGPATAWLRHWLMDDPNARTEFFGPSCGLCSDTRWSDWRRNAKALQIPG